MKRLSFLVVLVVFAGWAAASAGAATFKGSVVGRDAHRGAIAVAAANGAVHTVRVQHLRSLGARVTVRAARRPDGTFRAQHLATRGRTSKARVRGVVLRSTSGRTFLSAGGTVLSVRGAKGLRAGRSVTLDVAIRKDGLHHARIVSSGSTAGLIEVEGTIASLAPLKITLEHGATIQLTVPAALTLPAGLAVGDQVEAIVAFDAGAYTLVTIESDDQAEQGGDDDHGDEVEVKGKVTALTQTSITVGTTMFAVPSGFDLSGVKVGSLVEAKGVRVSGVLTLTRLHVEDEHEDGDDDHGDHHGGDHGGDDGDGHHGGDDGGHDGD